MDASPKPRKRSRKKLLKVFVITLLVLLSISLVYDAIGRAKLNRAMEAAEAMGGPVTLEQMVVARKTYPEDKNGAIVILGIKDRLAAIREQAENERIPIWSRNAEEIVLGKRWSSATGDRVRKFLDSADKELAAIDTLNQYEGGCYPIKLEPCPLKVLLPHLAPTRTACQLKALEILNQAMKGDSTQLADGVSVMLHIGNLLNEELSLIAVLVKVACSTLTLRTIEDVCALSPITSDDLLKLQTMLSGLDEGNRRISWAIRSERAFFVGMLDYLRKTGDFSALSEVSSRPSMRSELLPLAYWFPGIRGFIMQDGAKGIELFNQILAATEQTQGMTAAKIHDEQCSNLGMTSPITQLLTPAFSRSFVLDTRLTAEVRCAVTSMAVERYRIDLGEFPRELEQLVPKYLDTIPADPFLQNQPLKYAVKGDRVIIYSVGADGNDNGGNVNHEKTVDKEKGDDGFVLLLPAARNQPPPPPTTSTSAPTTD